MLKINQFTFNPFQENTYIAYDETKECVIIDPGCMDKNEEHELKSFIESNGLKPVLLLNTHCHVDHVLGNFFCKNTYKIPLYIHKLDEPTLLAVKAYAPSYGFGSYQETTPDKFIDEKDVITFGNSTFEVLFVPGHAPGHVAFYNKEAKICLAGDVLFYRSVGRTDLPGGNFDTLIKSIRTKLFTLPDETVVYPGHGPSTKIGFEKTTNPFCA